MTAKSLTALRFRDSPADVLRRPRYADPGKSALFGGFPFRSPVFPDHLKNYSCRPRLYHGLFMVVMIPQTSGIVNDFLRNLSDFGEKAKTPGVFFRLFVILLYLLRPVFFGNDPAFR